MDTPRVTGHREALRRLRLVMAGSGSAEERLAEIVRIIAAEMSAEVCSIYVLRVGDILELFATQGLNPDLGTCDTPAGRGRPCWYDRIDRGTPEFAGCPAAS